MSALVPYAGRAAAAVAPGLARRVLASLGRTAVTIGGLELLDAGLDRVSEWLANREWAQGRRHHQGVDLRAPVGTPVLSPTDAIVIGKQSTPDGGNELFLAGPRAFRAPSDDPSWPRPARWFAPGTAELGGDTPLVNDSGWRFGFSHLQAYNAEVGDLVSRGKQIATTGQSGTVTGPHLHLTTFWLQDGVPDLYTFVDPGRLIPGVTPSTPAQRIGPDSWVTVCLLVRPSSHTEATARCVLQRVASGGLVVNLAATINGVR